MKITVIVENIEEKKVILKTDDNKKIFFPREKLPDNIQEGMALNFHINNKNEEKNQAKEILNEILNINHD